MSKPCTGRKDSGRITASGRRPIYCGWAMDWGRERAEGEAKINTLGKNCYEQMTATFKSVGSCPPPPPKKNPWRARQTKWKKDKDIQIRKINRKDRVKKCILCISVSAMFLRLLQFLRPALVNLCPKGSYWQDPGNSLCRPNKALRCRLDGSGSRDCSTVSSWHSHWRKWTPTRLVFLSLGSKFKFQGVGGGLTFLSEGRAGLPEKQSHRLRPMREVQFPKKRSG